MLGSSHGSQAATPSPGSATVALVTSRPPQPLLFTFGTAVNKLHEILDTILENGLCVEDFAQL